MDPLVQIILSTGSLVVAAVIAVVIGSRKGIADIEARTDAEMARLVEALEGRVKVLTEALAQANRQVEVLRSEVHGLRVEVAELQQDLKDEQRITARLTGRAK